MNMKFGRLTVTGISKHVDDRPAFACRCDCGNICSVQRKKLMSGHTKSCGCLQKQRSMENLSRQQKLLITHGKSNTLEWRAWMRMKTRVKSETKKSFNYYKNKNITVHPAWINDFEAFLKDVGFSPSREHSLDRIDNSKNYEPGNVRWASKKQQNRNKKDNIVVEWKGEKRLFIELMDEINLPYGTVWRRLRNGWAIEKALTTPLRHN